MAATKLLATFRHAHSLIRAGKLARAESRISALESAARKRNVHSALASELARELRFLTGYANLVLPPLSSAAEKGHTT